MYDVFDQFLSKDTWHKNHPLDDASFYRALATVVRDPQFSPDRMADYMMEKKGLTPESHPEGDLASVYHRRTEAWAIKDFLALGL